MTKTRLDLPYVWAAGDGGPRSLTQLVVIHATDNTATAAGEAAYCSHRPDQTSCHVFVDATSAVQVLPLDHIAYGCFPTGNSRSIQFELCGLSNQVPAAVIARAAGLVAQVCALWSIPAVHLTPAQAVAGQRGIIGHDGVTAAWHEGDHTDPGAVFPWTSFITQVQIALGGTTHMGFTDDTYALAAGLTSAGYTTDPHLARYNLAAVEARITAVLARIEAKVDAALTAIGAAAPGNADVVAILAGVDTRLAALRTGLEADLAHEHQVDAAAAKAAADTLAAG
jgi:N-acetyl-anhydromuramyl-L-alanine amidase AmpD